jgi:hypothetical protein
MPTISESNGVLNRMSWNGHAPPHFHAMYAECEAPHVIDTLEVLRGIPPRRAHALVLEWAAQDREEPREDWQPCEARQMPKKIAPLW